MTLLMIYTIVMYPVSCFVAWKSRDSVMGDDWDDGLSTVLWFIVFAPLSVPIIAVMDFLSGYLDLGDERMSFK